IITTVAGNAKIAFSGDGGPATAASLTYPSNVAVDAAGNLYIADSGNNRIRKVTSNGIISTVAGNGTTDFNGDGIAVSASLFNPGGLAVDKSGALLISDTYNERVRKLTSDVRITTIAGTGRASYNGDNIPAISAYFFSPGGITLDSAGNIYVA